MKQKVEFLVPVSIDYLYWERVGEMGENESRQDGGVRKLSISILKSIKLHVLLYFSTQKLQVNRGLYLCKEYIFHFRLMIYILNLFTNTFTTI